MPFWKKQFITVTVICSIAAAGIAALAITSDIYLVFLPVLLLVELWFTVGPGNPRS